MMGILHERQLSLSRKKSRIGKIDGGFHYLGVNYLPTQPEDNTNVTRACNDIMTPVHSLAIGGGGRRPFSHQSHVLLQMVPHARTLRKARTQVQLMVSTGFSTRRIRNYLHRHVLWWAHATGIWNYEEIIKWFCDACLDVVPTAHAVSLLLQHIRKSHSLVACHPALLDAGLAVAATAA